MSLRWVNVICIAGLFALPAFSAISRDGVFSLPMECSELLPDNGPFLQFFEAVARGRLQQEQSLSRRIFGILAMREKLQKVGDGSSDQNQIDLLIRKTLCFYREKEPLKNVSYKDPEFLTFLRGSLADLEAKVESTFLGRLIDKQRRAEYEKLLNDNQELEERVRTRAEVDADRNFERLSQAARRKARAR